MDKPKKQKHNYTSELELKSLLIRIKNDKYDIGSKKLNSKINKYIRYHTGLKNNKNPDSSKRMRIRNKLKEKIIAFSENTSIDKSSYERFGVIILLMIKNILKKPQFSGYTYSDDFYSDAVYKILKYLHNFDHTKISKITNQPVNSFSYITQIIHNSIIYIINTKNKENERMRKRVEMENLNHSLQLKTIELMHLPEYEMAQEEKIENVYLESVETNLIDELKNLQHIIKNNDRVNIYYPKEYVLYYEELAKLTELMHSKVSIIRGE